MTSDTIARQQAKVQTKKINNIHLPTKKTLR